MNKIYNEIRNAFIPVLLDDVSEIKKLIKKYDMSMPEDEQQLKISVLIYIIDSNLFSDYEKMMAESKINMLIKS